MAGSKETGAAAATGVGETAGGVDGTEGGRGGGEKVGVDDAATVGVGLSCDWDAATC